MNGLPSSFAYCLLAQGTVVGKQINSLFTVGGTEKETLQQES